MQILEIDLANFDCSDNARDVLLVGVACMQFKALLSRRTVADLLAGVTELATKTGADEKKLRESMIGSLASMLLAMMDLMDSDAIRDEMQLSVPKEVFELLDAKAAGHA